MSLDNRLEAYACNSSLNAPAVITFIDDFVQKITPPTVVVIDNASIHHAEEFHWKIDNGKSRIYVSFICLLTVHNSKYFVKKRCVKFRNLAYLSFIIQ